MLQTRRHFRFQSNAERLLADSTGNIVNKFEHDGRGGGWWEGRPCIGKGVLSAWGQQRWGPAQREQRLGNCTKKVTEPYTLIQAPHPPVNRKNRHTTENITFPQLRRLALKNSYEFLYLVFTSGNCIVYQEIKS